MHSKLLHAHEHLFQQPAQDLIRSPGRVNIIGEHTDYNDGFVFPIAIDQATWVTMSPREDEKIVVQSLNFQEATEIDIQDNRKPEHITWPE
jgi:galactokinase